jgi:hypothetical protein
MKEWLRTKLGSDPRIKRLEEDLEAMRVQCAAKDKLIERLRLHVMNARAQRDEAQKRRGYGGMKRA